MEQPTPLVLFSPDAACGRARVQLSGSTGPRLLRVKLQTAPIKYVVRADLQMPTESQWEDWDAAARGPPFRTTSRGKLTPLMCPLVHPKTADPKPLHLHDGTDKEFLFLPLEVSCDTGEGKKREVKTMRFWRLRLEAVDPTTGTVTATVNTAMFISLRKWNLAMRTSGALEVIGNRLRCYCTALSWARSRGHW